MAAYHIVFIPCSFSSGTSCNSSQPAGTPKVQQNLKQYVAAGGKLYATDYAYEFVRQPWPGFISRQCTSEPIGMFFSGSALPGLIGASAPDRIGSPTCARFGAKM